MRCNEDEGLRGEFGAGPGMNELFSIAGRRLWPTLGRLAVVAFLIAGGAILFTGDLSEPGQDVPRFQVGAEPASPVEAVAFSPDGRTIAGCGWDASVCVWDISRKGPNYSSQPTYLNHDSARFALAFSPDGRDLASAGKSSLAVWSCESGTYKPLVEKTGLAVRCLSFSPDSRTLALGGDDGAVRLWDSSIWRERAILLEHTDAVRYVAFSPDGRRLVSSGQDRRVMLWDAIRGVAIRQLCQPGTNPIQLAAFAPDGKTIAIGELSGIPYDVELVHPETGAIRSRLSGHAHGVCAMAFSPDGQTLATAGDDGCIKLWDFGTGEHRRTISERVGHVRALAFSPNGAQLAFPDLDENLRLLDLKPKGARLFSRVLRKDAARPGSTPVRPIHS